MHTSNTTDRPLLAGLPAKYRSRVLTGISVDIPLLKVVGVIPDDAQPPSGAPPLKHGYWRRRSAAMSFAPRKSPDRSPATKPVCVPEASSGYIE